MRLEPCDSVVLATTASTTIVNGECIVQGVVLAPAAASCTISLYDPPVGVMTTTGATLKVIVTGAANGVSGGYNGSGSGIRFLNGCVAVVTGAGAQATIIHAHI